MDVCKSRRFSELLKLGINVFTLKNYELLPAFTAVVKVWYIISNSYIVTAIESFVPADYLG